MRSKVDVSRRFFIGGAASFGAFGGSRFLECHDFRAGGEPNLKFGVVSDIHVTRITPHGEMDHPVAGGNATFRHALEWFRNQGVHAVMIAGDLADNGMDNHLAAVADAWYSVFPEDRYPDGRPVEKVFVSGNHDQLGFRYYGNYAEKQYPDVAERRRHILLSDMKGWWEKLFHEEYTPFYAKEIRGYRFLGAHWDNGKGIDSDDYGVAFGAALGDWLAKNGKNLDPAQPFFYVQHPHPKDTCYGSWALGHDQGLVTKHLSSFANAIAISGHSHYSLTDERSVWQGTFTSVGAGSLRYTGRPYNERPPVAYENSQSGVKDGWRHDAVKFADRIATEDCRQGMLWSVYDDCIVVRRREFLSGLDLGDDWVLPLPSAESKPFAFAAHSKRTGVPRFAADAALKVVRTTARTRGGKSRDGKETIPAVSKDVFRVTAPAPVADKTARAFEFAFVAESPDGTKTVKMMLAEGFNHASTHTKAKASTSCCFAIDGLPPGDVRFSVTPMNCFHRPGVPLVTDWISRDKPV